MLGTGGKAGRVRSSVLSVTMSEIEVTRSNLWAASVGGSEGILRYDGRSGGLGGAMTARKLFAPALPPGPCEGFGGELGIPRSGSASP